MSWLLVFLLLTVVPWYVFAAIAMVFSVPVALLAAISAWNDYTSPVPIPDALYLSSVFWGIEIMGVLSLLYIIAVGIDSLRRY
jgi:hypothetical protein